MTKYTVNFRVTDIKHTLVTTTIEAKSYNEATQKAKDMAEKFEEYSYENKCALESDQIVHVDSIAPQQLH